MQMSVVELARVTRVELESKTDAQLRVELLNTGVEPSQVKSADREMLITMLVDQEVHAFTH